MASSSEFAAGYLLLLKRALDALPLVTLDRIIAALDEARARRRQVFIAGDGGSAATASHMMSDLCETTLGPPPTPPARASARSPSPTTCR